MRRNNFHFFLPLFFVVFLSGCASLINQQLAGNLSQAILNQNDPEIVRAGAPAYLLMIDGLIEGDPDDQPTLLAGARLYGVYAAVFVDDPERARRMSDKALGYARRAMCLQTDSACGIAALSYDEFIAQLVEFADEEIDTLYTNAMTWALWIQLRSSDWNAVADLPKVEAMLQRVVALREDYEEGQPHLYLGIMRTLLPPAMGGKPEQGREHFERAIELSNGGNLSAKVEYARRYARLVFDRKLHDRLLQEVLQADPVVPGYTLGNTLAQKQAVELLAGSEEYFGE